MKKILITICILVLVSLAIFVAGRQGVVFHGTRSLPAHASFKFISDRGEAHWIIKPVESGSVNLGWRIIGRYEVMHYRMESDGKLIISGHLTVPRFGYARLNLDDLDQQTIERIQGAEHVSGGNGG